MLTMFDILKKQDFRAGLEAAIRPYKADYSLPEQIPLLYRYCRFSQYAVDNIRNNGLSLSLIATFNDCYDSTISFGDIMQRATEEYEKDLRIATAAGCTPWLTAEDWYNQIVNEQEAHRGFSNDSYCCCFSQSAESTLMWSHYASNNRGICIEYDFESIQGHPLYHSLLPVAYTDKPINVYDYVHESKGSHSIETGVLVSVLNKASCWEYEKEWRLVLLNESLNKQNIAKYITCNNVIAARSIIFGQHFLDNFIPELNRNGTQGAEQDLQLLRELSLFLKSNNIPTYQAMAVSNSFDQYTTKPVDIDAVVRFIEEESELNQLALQNRNYLYLNYHSEVLEELTE